MNNTLTVGSVKAIRVQDIAVLRIIQDNNWKRPIYFATTCSQDSRLGLDQYLKIEGMAFRLVPEQANANTEFVNEPALRQEVLHENYGFNKNFERGFKFRGLNNPDIFFDDNHQRMLQNYRTAFLRLALYYQNTNQNSKAIAVLDTMSVKIPKEYT